MHLNGYLHLASIVGVSKMRLFELFSGWKWKSRFSFPGFNLFICHKKRKQNKNSGLFSVLQTAFFSAPRSWGGVQGLP